MSNQTLQIMSIESNDASRQALRSLLTHYPGLVLAAEASNAAQAMQQLQSHEIDVVLLDLGLPDMDAIGLIKHIRQSHKSARVLIVTASDLPEDIFSSMNAGADAYVLKGNVANVLDIAIRSTRLGAVWLDPGIARQVLKAIEMPAAGERARMLPTGYMPIPLLDDEKSKLSELAGSADCKDGVCMVDPSFIKKLKRFSPATAQ